MVKEGGVLFGIEHLEQSASGISVVSATNLVNLVDKNKRVLGTDALQRLDDLARESTT